MSEERQKAAVEINKMADVNGGKIFMGMVHDMYGPLRGLNFILDNPNVELVMDALDTQSQGMELEDQMKLAEDVISWGSPENPEAVCS